MITEKGCPSCGVVKPVSDFGRNQSLADGRSFYCLECCRARNRAWYREKRRALGEEIRDHSWVPAGFRWCPSCRRAVAHDDYMRSSRTASGFGSRCRPCHNAANSECYFQRKHRLSKSQVADLKAAQGGRRAVVGPATGSPSAEPPVGS